MAAATGCGPGAFGCLMVPIKTLAEGWPEAVRKEIVQQNLVEAIGTNDLRKIFTGLVYLLTGGLLLIGVLYDFWTLNSQVSEQNRVR